MSDKVLSQFKQEEAIEEVIKDRRQRRLSSQPLEYPSAGSVFRNPPDDFAGRLIEELGYNIAFATLINASSPTL